MTLQEQYELLQESHPGTQICKHIWAVLQHLDNDIPEMLKMMGSTQSTATATTQPDEPLEAPEAPAGTPSEGTRTEDSIRSEAAEETVAADIEDIQSHAETLDLPKMNTSNVDAKPIEAETKAQKGPEEVEPPIEEPSLPENTEVEEETKAAEMDELEEPIEDERITESFNQIYEKSKYTEFPSMDWDGFPIEEMDPDDRYRWWADCIKAKCKSKLKTIPLNKIVQEFEDDDTDDYDWEQFDNISDGNGKIDIKPIDVFHFKDQYCVMDGNHRATIASEKGYDFIDAHVYELPKHLQEKKDHLIKKLPNLDQEEKEKLIVFFNKNPHAESKIDWNKKNLKFSDFSDVMESAEKTKSKNIKKSKSGEDLSAIWKDVPGTKVYYHDSDQIFVAPFTYKAAVFMNSFNAHGIGAKWCIGTTNTAYGPVGTHWKNYTQHKRHLFLMQYDRTENKKFMIEYNPIENTANVWDQEDTQIGNNMNLDYIQKLMSTNGKLEEVDLYPIFKDIKEEMNKKSPKGNQRVIDVTGNKDYMKEDHGPAFGRAVEWFLKDLDEIEAEFGGGFDLKYNGNQTFTLTIRDHDTVFLNDDSNHGIVFGKREIPILLKHVFKRSIADAYNSPVTGLESTAEFPALISEIICKNFILTNISEYNYNEDFFPNKLTGNVIFKECEFDKHYVNFLPKEITGTITFTDCNVSDDTINYYAENILNIDPEKINKTYENNLSEMVTEKLKNFYYGKPDKPENSAKIRMIEEIPKSWDDAKKQILERDGVASDRSIIKFLIDYYVEKITKEFFIRHNLELSAHQRVEPVLVKRELYNYLYDDFNNYEDWLKNRIRKD